MHPKAPVFIVLTLLCVAFFARDARAHCDTLNGPVVSAARVALERNDVTPVLKWIRESEEAEVRDAFRQAMSVRSLTPAAQVLADRFFFETVVRLHRFGEGEPYTGLKAEAVDEVVAGADRALEVGNVEPVARLLADRAAAEVRKRFASVRALQPHADENVAAGRRYVEAYVAFVHFVEELNALGAD